MPPLPSPRLPGVVVLRPEATGPEYARWRREVRAVFTAKGTWGHCDGTSPMPMPEAGPNFFSPAAPTNFQPQLLEERKAWVKKDRDVKLDLFLSVADDIKLEVFDVGPPLPPVSMTAREMMEALDIEFAEFKFEDYHHVFCHFLNLHIDQYANIEDFNAEFQATLDDLLDHGHPMSNIQACSAYFSKLRCTQNPWVATKLKEWDALELETPLEHLMKQSPPWSIIRPLNAKPTSSHHSLPESIPEEHLEDTPHQSDGEYAHSEHSVASTASSKSSNYSQSQYSHSRDISVITTRSQEITIHASFEDLSDLSGLGVFPNVPMAAQHQHRHTNTPIPKRVSSISKMTLAPPPPPINRPLPPLPPNRTPTPSERSRSVSPISSIDSGKSGKSTKRVQLPVLTHANSLPGMEAIHPALRSPTPTPRSVPEEHQSNIHPALRSNSPTPPPQRTMTPTTPTTPPIVTTVVTVPSPAPIHISDAMQRPSTASPQLPNSPFSVSTPRMSLFPAPPTANFAMEVQRPSSSRSAILPHPNYDSFSLRSPPLLRIDSNNSSTISLPLQGFSPENADVPEFKDTLITEASRLNASTPPPSAKPLSRIDLARLRFEGIGHGSASPPRGLSPPIGREEKESRKRSWSIKARLSARHGIKEII